MSHHITIVRKSVDHERNEIVAEVRWIDSEGQEKCYRLKKTSNDSLAIDYEVAYLPADGKIQLSG